MAAVYLSKTTKSPQLAFRVYEELYIMGNFFGILRTFGGVHLEKISKFLGHLGEHFGILRTFLIFKEILR